MSTHTAPAPSPVNAAVGRIVDRTLARNASLFTNERRLWTGDTLAALAQRVTRARDADGDTFAGRWGRSLRRATPAQRLLAAELAYVHLVFASDLRPVTKRALVTATLPPQVAMPPLMDAALESGIAGTGVAFTRRRLSQLSFLARAYADWKTQPAPSRREALADPWVFKNWLTTIPVEGGHAQREALLHLVHPDTFEPLVSLALKTRIAKAYAGHVPAGVDDLDAQLAAIRASLARRRGAGFTLLDLPIEGVG